MEPTETRPPLSTVEGLDPSTVKSAVLRLDGYLATANFGLAYPAELLLSTKMRQSVVARSVKFVTSLYERFYNYVIKSQNLYADPQQLLPRTPQQVNALMG